MKIRTQNCGIVDVEPKDVFEIWEGGFGVEGEFTHTLRCRDVTGKYQHHVHSIRTIAALRLSELSGISIDKIKFGKEDSEEKEETNETIDEIEKPIEPKKENSTLMEYVPSAKN